MKNREEIQVHINDFVSRVKLKDLKLLYEESTTNICDDKTIKACVNAAYNDAHRVLSGIKDDKKAFEAKEHFLNEYLPKEINKYLLNEKEDANYFNSLHNKWCEELEKESENHIKYGFAQKIINLTFKYLYCFPDAVNYENKFINCHATFDDIVYKWCVANKIVKKRSDWAWSKLGKDEYIDLKNKYNNYIETKNNRKESEKYTILQSEFIIWRIEQLREACDSLNKVIVGSDKLFDSNAYIFENNINDLNKLLRRTKDSLVKITK